MELLDVRKISKWEKNKKSIYGRVGINGSWCLDYLRRMNIEVLGFIDSNSKLWGPLRFGVPVMSYDDCKKCVLILVTAKHFVKDIIQTYRDNFIVSFDEWYVSRKNTIY